MTGFLNEHGTPLGDKGRFASLKDSDDEAAVQEPDFVSDDRYLSDPFAEQQRIPEWIRDDLDDLDEDKSSSYELSVLIDMVKLDCTGIVDLKDLDNPHRNFDPHTWDDWNGEWVPDAEFDGFGVVRDGKEVFALSYCQFEYQCEEQDKEEDFRPLDRFWYEDPGTAVPTFSSNRTHMYHVDWYSEDDAKSDRKRRSLGARKSAKFRIDGKRSRKDNRDHRVGNRQEFTELRDFWADRFDMWEEFAREWNPPTIPEFGVEMVGMSEADASYYEAEAQHEREDYIRELEMSLWLDNVELDESHLFDPVNNTGLLVDIWERHLFPERFEYYRPYHFSEWGYYDDGYEAFGYYDERDRYDDDRHLDGLDLEDLSDDGPTLEEWAELDRITMEQLLEEDDRFSPSFVGSRRTMLRYHLSEPRRGKLKRKFSKSGSFLYRQTGAPRRAMYT